MKTKRQTKVQKDEAAKAALRQRVDDLWIATTDEPWEEDGSEPWPESFIDFCAVLRRVFLVRENEDEGVEGNEYLWDLYQLKSYHNPEAATGHLFEHGVRA